jgi:hypothetical protein
VAIAIALNGSVHTTRSPASADPSCGGRAGFVTANWNEIETWIDRR